MNLFEKLKNNRKLIEQSSGQGSLFGGLFGGEGKRNRRGRQKGSKNKPKVVSNTVQTEIDFDEPRKKELANKVASKKEKLATRVKVEREKRRALKTGSDGKRARRQNPTTKKTVSQVKSDINFKDSLKKGGASGDLSYTMPSDLRAKAQAKRDARMKELGTPDPFDPDYDAKVKKVNPKSKIGRAFKSPKKPKTRAPKGDFGPGLTRGQANALRMDKRSFKKTQPSDIKLPKSFRDFSRDLQDFKDRDQPGGPRRTVSSRTSSKPSGSRFDPDIGMAPDDTPRRGVNQAEISKQQRDYTAKINQRRLAKSEGPPEFTQAEKDAQVKKLKDTEKSINKRQSRLLSKRERLRSEPGGELGRKDTRKLRKVNRKIRAIEKSTLRKNVQAAIKGQGNPFAPVVYDKANIAKTKKIKNMLDTAKKKKKKVKSTYQGSKVTSDADRVKGKYRQTEIPFDTPGGAQGTPPKVTKLGKFRKLVQTAKTSKLGKAAKFVSKVPFVGDIALAGTALYGISQYNKMKKSTPGSSGSGTTNKKSTELKFDNPNDVTRTSVRDKTGKKVRVPLGSSTETINKIKNNSNNIRYYKNIPMNK